MKKFFKNVFALLCILPLVILSVACGNDKTKNKNENDNTPNKSEASAFSVLKTALGDKKVLGSGKTITLTGLYKASFDGNLDGTVDSTTKSKYDTIVENLKEEMNMNKNVEVTMAYKDDGTAVLKSKQTNNETNEWFEDDVYVLKNGDDLILCNIYDESEYDEPDISFYKTDKYYFSKTLELNEFGYLLEGIDEEFFDAIKNCPTEKDFSKKLNEKLLEQNFEDGCVIDNSNLKTSYNFSYDETEKLFILTITMKEENLAVDMSSISEAETNTISYDIKVVLKFNSRGMVSYGGNATTEINSKSAISEESQSVNFVTKTTSQTEINCNFSDGVDDSLWNNDLINENMPERPEDFGLYNISVDVVANGVLSRHGMSYGYDEEINFESVKNDLLNNCIIPGFDTDAEAIKSVKYYLDEAQTIEFSAENITKFPSYSFIIYADIELNEDYSIIKYRSFGDGIDSMTFAKKGEFNLDNLRYGDTVLKKVVLDGVNLEPIPKTITIEAGKTYFIKIIEV